MTHRYVERVHLGVLVGGEKHAWRCEGDTGGRKGQVIIGGDVYINVFFKTLNSAFCSGKWRVGHTAVHRELHRVVCEVGE